MGKHWTIHARGLHLHRGRPRRWMPKGKHTFFIQLGSYLFRLTSVTGKGICVVARMLVARRYSADQRAEEWEFPSMKKRGAKGAGEGDAKHLAAMETARFADMLSLVEHCAIRRYDDGESRETGWITIKTIGSAWCVQVKDPDGCVSFTSTAESLDKALETAALLLACDDAPWEEDRYLKQQKAQKRK